MSPQWARNLRGVYDGEVKTAREKLIRDTLDQANDKAKQVRLGETSIRALYRLHKKHGPNGWISLNQMERESGIPLGEGPSRGLYIWDNEKGNGIVEKMKGRTQYRIVEEFYPHVEQVLKQRGLQ